MVEQIGTVSSSRSSCGRPLTQRRSGVRGVDPSEPRGIRSLVAHCHVGLGKLYRRTGKRRQAEEHLATATAMFREMDMTYWLEKEEAEMRELQYGS